MKAYTYKKVETFDIIQWDGKESTLNKIKKACKKATINSGVDYSAFITNKGKLIIRWNTDIAWRDTPVPIKRYMTFSSKGGVSWYGLKEFKSKFIEIQK